MEAKVSIYEQLGAENLAMLIDYFYDLVFSNESLSPLFSKTPKDEIKHKQLLFLTQFLGGPTLYSEAFGHPKMRARHLPHAITENGAIAWLQCMGEAIKKLEIDDTLKKDVFSCFPQAAFHMVNTENPA
jgi:hemoglobin